MNKIIFINNVECFLTDEKPKHGGNGEVYFYEDNKGNQYALKKFKHPIKNQNERFLRFKREIKFLKENDIYGIIPLIDSKEFDDFSKYKSNSLMYYVMPKAEPFIVAKVHSFGLITILNIFKELASILKCLHKKGLAHRDIKPENILIYKDKYCFSDFGLIWDMSGNRLTCNPEPIGPYKIMPPELELVNQIENIDFRKSDIYLLAKVLWMCLKNNNVGFRGCYNRGDAQIYLGFYEDGLAKSFEPINILLEKSTFENWSDRISIDDFILLIDKQIQVINDSVPETEIEIFNQNEVYKRIYSKIIPNFIITDDLECIFEFLNELYHFNKFKIHEIDSDKYFEIMIKHIQKTNSMFIMSIDVQNISIYLSFFPENMELSRRGKAKIHIAHAKAGLDDASVFDFNNLCTKSFLNERFEIIYEL